MTSHQAVDSPAAVDGLYVYCVARAGRADVLGPIGLENKVVYALDGKDICAFVHDCQAEPYQSEDPQTVKAWVQAHQRVVEAATEAFGTVLPMSFDMIVHGDPDSSAIENLRAWLDEKRPRFTRLLDKFAGKAEYGVQIFWDRKLLAQAVIKSDPELGKIQDEARNKPKGLAYMLQQKLASATRAALEGRMNSYAQDFYARIRQCVDEVRVDTLKKSESPGAPGMLLNLSCLIETDSPALGRTLDEIRKTEGILVRFTGPWPPYSFVGAG